MKRVIFLLALLAVGALYAVDPPGIQQIQTDPYSFLRDTVKLKGKVLRYNLEKTKTSKCYIFQDDYSDTIKVFTIESLPIVDQRYEITGMVTIVDVEGDKKEVNIFENERNPIGKIDDSITIDTNKTPPGAKTGGLVNVFFGIAAFLLVVIAVLSIFLIFNRNSKGPTSMSLSADSGGYSDPDPGTAPIESSSEVIENSILKMLYNSEKTMEMIPGRFEFIKSNDICNNIRFLKEITKKETEFLFGRKPRTDQDYIQLKSLTVSERQAKLHWANEKFMLINYSTTNPTKINGKRLAKDESASLEYGDTIEMGDVTIKMHEK